MDNANKEYINVWKEKFYSHNIDLGKFKDTDNIQAVIHMVRWTYKGLLMNLLRESEGLLDQSMISNLIEECDHYYEVLVSNLYR